MRSINLTVILFITLFQLASAQSIKDNIVKGIRTETEYQKLDLLKNTDNFNYDKNLDTNIIIYKSCIVKKRLLEVSEEIVIFHNGKTQNINNDSMYYFLGIKNNRYAIFDRGTSNERELIIYDFVKEKEVLKETYYSNLKIENNAIYFDAEAIIKDDNLKPKCPPEIEDLSYKIYLEKLYFDFQYLKIVHTGKYICTFIE